MASNKSTTDLKQSQANDKKEETPALVTDKSAVEYKSPDLKKKIVSNDSDIYYDSDIDI